MVKKPTKLIPAKVAEAIKKSGSLNFEGDRGDTVNRPLGSTLNIKGGVTNTRQLTDNNIGVVANKTTGTLEVKLAKDLKGITSIEAPKLADGKSGGQISFTGGNVDVHGGKIINVARPVDKTDAVNKGYLDDEINKIKPPTVKTEQFYNNLQNAMMTKIY